MDEASENTRVRNRIADHLRDAWHETGYATTGDWFDMMGVSGMADALLPLFLELQAEAVARFVGGAVSD